MERITFKIFINAPKQHVFETMLNKPTYEEWTSAFQEGSTYKGDWSEGSKILFTSTADNNQSGMSAVVKANRPYDFVSLQHLGEIVNGELKTWSESEIGYPADAETFENYTFTEKDGGTEVLVEMDTSSKYKEMFETMWPKALEKLKEVAER
ncbi:MAG TPA: SRPBCC domain-containing protein [Candidatus Paceibacterota bacterium]|nr:SRPBCC domain-containing protein [Candidatus Paceibacterota bacterium]